jgi:hypothetical protein
MSIELANTILVVAVFVAMLFCQVMSLRSKTKHNYKNSLFWDINTMLLAVNQEWIILDVAWYTIVMKGVLVGINGLGFICVVISAVTTIEYKLSDVPVIEPCETADDVIKREG